MGQIIITIGGLGILFTAFNNLFESKPFKKTVAEIGISASLIAVGMAMKYFGN